LLGGFRKGVGLYLSVATGLTMGLYIGKHTPSAESLSGFALFENIGLGSWSIGSSQNLNSTFNRF